MTQDDQTDITVSNMWTMMRAKFLKISFWVLVLLTAAVFFIKLLPSIVTIVSWLGSIVGLTDSVEPEMQQLAIYNLLSFVILFAAMLLVGRQGGYLFKRKEE